MKVTAILKGDPDSLGRKKVYIRTHVGEKRTFKATRLRVLPAEFKNGRVINHPQAKLYNDIIKKEIIGTEADHIKGDVPYPDAWFKLYTERLLRLWDQELEPSTLSQYRTEFDKFMEFTKQDIKLSKITVDLLNDYRAWLMSVKKNGSNTVWKSFKNLRRVFTVACKEKIVKDDPFDIFERTAFKNPPRDYLTQEDVDLIEHYIENHCPPVLKLYAGWFLIGCYTGLRYSDMRQFNREKHIKGGRLTLHTLKTGEIVSIPFNDKLKKLFSFVGYARMSKSDQKFNDNLKILTNACELKFPLTVHVARHTFAVRCATAGIPIEVTAKLMAQTDTKSTAVYYRITDRKVDDEFKKLF